MYRVVHEKLWPGSIFDLEKKKILSLFTRNTTIISVTNLSSKWIYISLFSEFTFKKEKLLSQDRHYHLKRA